MVAHLLPPYLGANLRRKVGGSAEKSAVKSAAKNVVKNAAKKLLRRKQLAMAEHWAENAPRDGVKRFEGSRSVSANR